VFGRFTMAVERLATLPTSLWLMDSQEHGSYLDALGGVMLLASAKIKNYDQFWKGVGGHMYSIPVYDSGGQLSINDLPVELEALKHVGFPHVDIEDLQANYAHFGPFPRATLLDPAAGMVRLQEDLKGVVVSEIMGTSYTALLRSDRLPLRLVYPEVDRKMLQPTGRSVIASAYVVRCLDKKRLDGDVAIQRSMAAAIVRTPQHVFDPAKIFEGLALEYISTTRAPLQARLLASAHGASAGDVGRVDVPLLLAVPAGGLALKYVETYKEALEPAVDGGGRGDSKAATLFSSLNRTEPAVDALLVDAERERMIAFQVTWNARHTLNGNGLAELAQLVGDTAKTIQFVWLVPKKSYDQFEKRPVDVKPTRAEQRQINAAKNSLSAAKTDAEKEAASAAVAAANDAAATGMSQRRHLLGRMEQWVALVPDDAVSGKRDGTSK
jgi:hypothetical protein